MPKTDPEIIAARDLISPSPEQRANHIWKQIHVSNKPRPWDLICFCAETFAVLSGELEFLKPIARAMISIVYTAHYHTPEIYPSSCPLPTPSPSSEPQSSTTDHLPVIELTITDESVKH